MSRRNLLSEGFIRCCQDTYTCGSHQINAILCYMIKLLCLWGGCLILIDSAAAKMIGDCHANPFKQSPPNFKILESNHDAATVRPTYATNNLIRTIALFDNDQRRNLSETEMHQFSSIGILSAQQPDTFNTTGVLVNQPNWVLTSAHTFFKDNRRQMNFRQFRFYLQSQSGNVYCFKIKRVIYANDKFEMNPNEDWVKIELASMAASEFSPFSLFLPESMPPQSALVMVGFHSDLQRGREKKIQSCSRYPITNQHPFANQPHLIIHDCDTSTGASGSPIFLIQNHSLHLIGIHKGSFLSTESQPHDSAYAFQPMRYFNYAVAVQPAMLRLFDQHHLNQQQRD